METASRFVAFCWVTLIFVWLISSLFVKPTKERQPLFGRLRYIWIIAVVAVLLNRFLREAINLTPGNCPQKPQRFSNSIVSN